MCQSSSVTTNQNGTVRTVIAFLIATLIVTFVYARLHYFFLSEYELLRHAFDARWWWGFQHLIDSPAFDATPVLQNRLHIRFITDVYLQNLLIDAARWTGIDLFTFNLLVTSTIHLITAGMLFVLGLFVLRSSGWAFLFAFIVLQLDYGTFMRYPVFVPKMLTFSLYPLLLLLCFCVSQRAKKFWVLAAFSSAGMFLYPAMFLYVMPSLFLVGFITGVFWRWDHGPNWAFVTRYVAMVVIWIGFLLTVRSLLVDAPKEAAAFEDFQLFYSFLVFSFPKTVLEYLSQYGLYVVISIVAIYVSLIRPKWPTDSEPSQALQFFALCSVVLLTTAMTAHILASSVALLRMLWTWRSAYYASVPAVLAGMILLKLFWPVMLKRARVIIGGSKGKPGNINGMKIAAVCLLLFAVVMVSPTGITNVKGALHAWHTLATSKGVSYADRDLEELVHAAKGTPVGSRILMPPLRVQLADTDIFEAVADRRVLLSRADIGHVNIRSSYTDDYVKALREYANIMALSDPRQRMPELTAFARALGATHILLPANAFVDGLPNDLPVVLRNDRWILFRVPTSTRDQT